MGKTTSIRAAGLILAMSVALLQGCGEPQASAPAPSAAAGFDPVLSDPPPDTVHPASMQTLVLQSHGASINAGIYEASGAGPHPTVVFLHGFPGGELNLDVAQAARRAGFNAVWFHYRGSWGSGGEFSFSHVLEDARAIVAAIREPAFAAAHRVDPARISVYGHSMGGFAALQTGAAEPELRCTVGVAGADFGALGLAAVLPSVASDTAEMLQGWGSGAIRGMSGERLVEEVKANAGRFALLPLAAALADRPILMVAAEKDDITPPLTNHLPLFTALRLAGASNARELRLDTDHAFGDSRIALTRGVVDFLRTNCM